MRREIMRTVTCAVAIFIAHASANAQARMPVTRADALLQEGRWNDAESMFYQQSERAPRDPVARAALGRYLAMKGAVRPGIVLIEEARQFGLDAQLARELVGPLRVILEWRTAARDLKADSTVAIRPTTDSLALFRVAFPRAGAPRVSKDPNAANEVVWHDVVDRQVGLDSLSENGSPIGIEVFEGLVPSVEVRARAVTLHASPRSALAAPGRRYRVLRTARGVWVLVGEMRAVRLASALRELNAEWWQLDLLNGILVVR
jgi:hypothetical protein